uniref:Uncharacterized protein n=1 Tax=Oryza barthii TaxID=65489 RepID=A0A0D3HSS3_9ORYZ
MGMDELNKAECISNTSCDVKVIIKIGKPRCFIGVVLLLATNMKWRREGVRASIKEEEEEDLAHRRGRWRRRSRGRAPWSGAAAKGGAFGAGRRRGFKRGEARGEAAAAAAEEEVVRGKGKVGLNFFSWVPPKIDFNAVEVESNVYSTSVNRTYRTNTTNALTSGFMKTDQFLDFVNPD